MPLGLIHKDSTTPLVPERARPALCVEGAGSGVGPTTNLSAMISQQSSLGECEPGATVEDLTGRVKEASVTRRLGDDMKNDGSHVGQSPVSKEVGPSSRLCVGRCDDDYGIGSFDFLTVTVENQLGWSVW
jgi:hypothetical protein